MAPYKLNKSLEVVFCEIEKKFDFKNITANNVPVWQFLRNIACSKLLSHVTTSKKSTTSKLKNLLRTSSLGSNPRPSNYVLFTDRYELVKNNDGVFVDKISQSIINTLKESLLVVISDAQGFKGSIKNVSNYLDASYFHIKRRLKPWVKVPRADGLAELVLAFKDLGLDSNSYQLEKYIYLFFVYCSVFDSWLSKVSPKVVFINCSYSLFHQSLIYACNIKKIKTVEMQHGLISSEHVHYSPSCDIGTETFPKHLLTFSDYHSRFINDNFIDKANIFPIGHYFREYKNTFLSESCLSLCKLLRKKYDKIILVSSQRAVERELCTAINYLAEKRPNYVFIFKQRQAADLAFKHSNIIVDRDHSIYDFINLVDINLSCFSTSVLEFLSSKTIGVLLDFNSLASNYFASIKEDSNNIFICKNRQEALRILSRKNYNSKVVEFYKNNNANNVVSFLRNLIL